MRFFLAHINDADETYLNGTLIGKTGAFPNDQGGYVSKWPATRNYCVAAGNPAIKWDAENIIAIKVFDGVVPEAYSWVLHLLICSKNLMVSHLIFPE